MLAQGYARTYRANAVLTASPGQLVLMLYDGALQAMAIAHAALIDPAYPRRLEAINHQLQKAQRILAELQGGLNLGHGGEFARTMHRLYDYHMRRLFEANQRKQLEPVVEVENLVRDLREAWSEMLEKQDGPVPAERIQSVA
jgi:flagellar secretion chaperone FliS